MQLEDAVDVISVMFPAYDFIFQYGQCSGHRKMRPDGLSVANMNVTYGGCATMMQTSKTMEVGPFEGVLNIGDTQSMNFSNHDSGLFWLSSMDKIKTKYDRKVGGRKLKKLSKIEVLTEIRKHGDTASRRL